MKRTEDVLRNTGVSLPINKYARVEFSHTIYLFIYISLLIRFQYLKTSIQVKLVNQQKLNTVCFGEQYEKKIVKVKTLII